MEGKKELIPLRCYTRAHRTPMVIGKLGDFRLPSPITLPQAGAIGVTFLLVWNTRNIWGFLTFGSGFIRFFLICAAPLTVGWIVRYAKVEGRKPQQAALGLLSAYVGQPLSRRLKTRPERPRREQWSPYFGGESPPIVAAAPEGGKAARAQRARDKEREAAKRPKKPQRIRVKRR